MFINISVRYLDFNGSRPFCELPRRKFDLGIRTVSDFVTGKYIPILWYFTSYLITTRNVY